MTREEAITLMKSAQLLLLNPRTNKPISDLYEAFDMAIKALEQEPRFIAKSDGTIEQIKNCDDCLYKKYKEEWEKIGKLLSVVLEKQTGQEPKTEEAEQ